MDIYSAVKPLYIASGIFAVGPCGMNTNRVRKFLDVLYRISIWTCMLLMFVQRQNRDDYPYMTLAHLMVNMLANWYMPISTFFFVVNSIVKQNEARTILQRLSEIDGVIRRTGSRPDHKTTYNVARITLFLITFGDLCTIAMYARILHPRDIVFRLFAITLRGLVEAQFIIVMYACWRNFRAGNAVLRAISCDQQSLFESDFAMTNRNRTKFVRDRVILENMKLVGRVHHETFLVTKLINSYHSLNLLICFMLNFILIIATLHFGLPSSPGIENRHDWATVVPLTRQAVEIVSIVAVAHFAQHEAGEMAEILHVTRFPNNTSKEIYSAIIGISMQALHSKVVLTACGVFKLHPAALTAMFGAVATYLIIIIQFEFASRSCSGHSNASFILPKL